MEPHPEARGGTERWLVPVFLALVALKAALLLVERTDFARAQAASSPALGTSLRVVGLVHATALIVLLARIARRDRPPGSEAVDA
jgi:hypothetical protein